MHDAECLVAMIHADTVARLAIEERLSRLGCSARDLGELLGQGEEDGSPLMIWLDLALPSAELDSLVQRIHARWPGVPLLGVTELLSPAQAEQAERWGVDEILVSPLVGRYRLDNAVACLLDRHRQRQARESEHLLKSTLHNLLIGVVVHAADTRILLSNPEASQILGLSEDQLAGRTAIDPWWRFVDTDLQPLPYESYPVNRILRGETSFKNQILGVRRPDRSTLTWVSVNAVAVPDDGRPPERVIVNFIDITRTRAAEAQVHALSTAMQQSPVAVVLTDPEGRIRFFNRAASSVLQRGPTIQVGESLMALLKRSSPEGRLEELTAAFARHQPWSGELLHRLGDGTRIWMQVHLTPVHRAQGQVTDWLFMEEDISIRKQQEARILHQAQFDALTELPNRVVMMDRLNQAIRQAHREQRKVALMFIDLDDFKKVNDSLGHEIGDRLLIEAASRLVGAVREDDTVARHGGDEFLVVVGGLGQSSDTTPIVEAILEAFSRPFHIDDLELMITPSIGLALYPDDGQEPSLLLRNADAAMYRAKDEGGNGFAFFTSQFTQQAERRIEIERHLKRALARQELSLVYQPIVATISRKIVGAEVLLRWCNPDLGRVMPDEFIPVAEQSGLIVPIGAWVMAQASHQVETWNQRYDSDLLLAVNVSPRQFRQQGILETVRLALASGMAPESLELEITEGLLLRNYPDTQALLAELRSMGCHLSMDDFGTGYSSLNYLKRLPFSTLKIDRSFVRDLMTDPEDRALVVATLQMARALSLRVVAEGVETLEQLRFLEQHGCDYVQGYLFSPPVPPAAFEELLGGRLWQGLSEDEPES